MHWFSPLDYGAVGDGVTNDGPAIRACLVAARAWASSVPVVTGYNDTKFRIPVVDLSGMSYATNIQIEVPGGQGMVIQNGAIHAGAEFTSELYLMSVGSSADPTMLDGFRNVNTTFRNMYFDNHHVGGGLQLTRFMRIAVDRCLFAHYETKGLALVNNAAEHEAIITNCQFGEYWWNETDHAGFNHADLFTGTALDIDTNDNMVSNCVIQLSKIGIKVNRAANQFNCIHIWTGYVKTPGTVAGPGATLDYLSTGLWITANAVGTQFNQMYMDGCEVLWETPWKTQFTNSFFLNGWGDPNRAFIRFKPMAANRYVDGVIITGNVFQVSGGGLMKMTSVDSSVGTFNAGMISRCKLDDNAFTGVTPSYTNIKMSKSLEPGSVWTFDMTGMMAFGDVVQQVMMSSYQYGGGTSLVRVTSLSGAIVTVGTFAISSPTTPQNTNATIYIEATINKTN